MEIKGYEVIRELNRGPITTVYLATQLALQRPVIIKQLNPQWEKSDDIAERFRREALICARLRHPNIVTMFDVVSEGSSVILVMEYIDGRNLQELISGDHPVPINAILSLSQQIADGLSYAHREGVIHRDIKPANIMVTKDGVVKISDFGLARMADMPGVTAEGGTVGTPAYMSPEQAMGQQLNASSDLFGLGATLYHLASGTSPFAAETVAATIQQVLEKHPPPLTGLRPELPESFSRTIMQFLAKEPADRPPLKALLAGTAKQNAAERQKPTSTVKTDGFLPLFAISAAVILSVILGWWFFSAQPATTLAVPSVSDSLDTATLDSSLSIAVNDTVEKEKTPLIREKLPATKAAVDSQLKISEHIDNKNPVSILPPADTTRNQASKPASLQPALLTIFCTPWAEITLNGAVIDTTPTSQPLELDAATYQIILQNPGFQPFHDKITLQPGKHDTLSATLQPRFGYLELRISPWAHVFVNEEGMGTSPFAEPLRLPPGKHLILLRNPAFKDYQEEIDITAGNTLVREVFLR